MASLRNSNSGSNPEDIQQGWLDFCRKMQASLCRNNGIALLTVTVAANGSNAVAWLPPKVEEVDPVVLASQIDMTDETYQILFSLLQSKNGV